MDPSIYVSTTLDTPRTLILRRTCTSTSSTEAVTQWGWAHCCLNLLRQLSLSELPALAARSIGFLSRSPGSYGGWGWIAGTSCVRVGGYGGGAGGGNNRARAKMSAFHVVFRGGGWADAGGDLAPGGPAVSGSLCSADHWALKRRHPTPPTSQPNPSPQDGPSTGE